MPATLIHSPADIIRYMFVNLGLGTLPENGGLWPIHVGGEPSTPDKVITVYDTTGVGQGRIMFSGEIIGPQGIQVRIRAPDHVTGWLKADAVQTSMAEEVYQESVTIDGTEYLVHALVRIGDVMVLGNESPTSKRKLFTINAQVQVKDVT